MDVFDLRSRLVGDYRDYTRSFIRIRDPRIEAFVEGHLAGEGFWPEPLLQLNPNFDGPSHDTADQIREYDNISQALMVFGYIVIRFPHAEE